MVKHGYSPIQRDSSPRVEADPAHQAGQTEPAAAQSDQPAKSADRHTPSGGSAKIGTTNRAYHRASQFSRIIQVRPEISDPNPLWLPSSPLVRSGSCS